MRTDENSDDEVNSERTANICSPLMPNLFCWTMRFFGEGTCVENRMLKYSSGANDVTQKKRFDENQ